ncbi:terpene synthase family protein [Streptomyces sp. NPDC054887]
MSVTEVELPPIFCPLESAIHSRVRSIEARAEAWVRASGMGGDDELAWIVASHSADFFARFAPTADADRVLVAALWVYWGFGFDDARCDNGPLSTDPAAFGALAGQVQRAVEAPSAVCAAEPYVAAVQDIMARFRTFGGPAQLRRFATAHRAWLSGVTWQIGNAARGHMPDLDEFLAMRLLSCGGEPTFAMLELATGVEVPGREMHRPVVRALTEMAMLLAALDNDRHSLRKELSRGHTDQNVYTVLMRHHDLSLREAVEAATRLRDRVMLRFLDVYEQVRPQAGAELDHYLRGLRYGVRGNAEWGLRVPRYLSLGHVPEGLDDTPLEWAERPADDDRSPLRIPSVAWWWDEDLLSR